jgi:hypothetical protein
LVCLFDFILNLTLQSDMWLARSERLRLRKANLRYNPVVLQIFRL